MSAVLRTLVVLLALSAPFAASGHALPPSVLSLSDIGDARIAVAWRYSLADPGAAELRPVFPAGCTQLESPRPAPTEAGFEERRWRMDCAAAADDALLRIEGLAAGQRSVLLRHFGAEAEGTQLLDGGRASAPLWGSGPAPALDTARAYLLLGVEHLVLGPDHLLFVVGLFLLVGRRRALLAVTLGFTLGHSVTLGASVLGYLRLPQALAEWGIAASIVWLAWRVLRRQPSAAGSLGLSTAAFGFGLLHGLGFAGALAELGVPEAQLWLALLAFNIGIELGQLLVVLALLLLTWLMRHAPSAVALPQARPGVAYLMGAMGAFWFIDRGLLLLPSIH